MAVAEVDAVTIVVGVDAAVDVATTVNVGPVVELDTVVVGTAATEINGSDVVGIVRVTRESLSEERAMPFVVVVGGGGGSGSTLDVVVASTVTAAAVDCFLDKLGDVLNGGRGSELVLDFVAVSAAAAFDSFLDKLGDDLIGGGRCRLATTGLETGAVLLLAIFV